MSSCVAAYSRGLIAGSRSTIAHSGGIVSLSNGTDAGGQGIVTGGAVVEVVVVPLAICLSCCFDAVVMGHGIFQLGQVDGVGVFTAGGYAGDLAADAAAAYGEGSLC